MARGRFEKDPRAWGAIAATLGRLPYTTAADVDEVEIAIARVLPSATATAIQIDAVLGAVEGLEALARQSAKISKLKPATLNGLRAAAGLEGRAEDADKLTRIRRLATLALTTGGGVTRPRLEAGAADPDDEVRRLTMIAARAEIDGRDAVIAKGLVDANPRVRYDALQTWSRLFQKASCEPLTKAIGDSNPHVVLLAVDLLGNGCPGDAATLATTLQRMAAGLTTEARTWHRPSHALVSLARVAPAAAQEILPRFVGHATWQVRMYAARAAGTRRGGCARRQLGQVVVDLLLGAPVGQVEVAIEPGAALGDVLEQLFERERAYGGEHLPQVFVGDSGVTAHQLVYEASYPIGATPGRC